MKTIALPLAVLVVAIGIVLTSRHRPHVDHHCARGGIVSLMTNCDGSRR